MKTYEIDIFKNFKCAMGDCPQTCCRGWKVEMDDATLGRVDADLILCKDASDQALAKKVKKAVKGREVRYVAKRLHKCPFELEDGRCQLHRDGYEKYMSSICREYPRRVISYKATKDEVEQELTLEMACPEVAKLFINHEGYLHFEETESDATFDTTWKIGNCQPEYFAFLKESRGRVLNFIESTEAGIADIMAALFEYVQRYHYYVLKHELDNMDDIYPEQFLKETGKDFCFYSLATMDKILAYNVYNSKLYTANYPLYKNIKLYNKHFKNIDLSRADMIFESKMKEMLEADPDLTFKYKKYLHYYFQETYLSTYEDYYLMEKMMLGFCNVQLLMLMDLANFLEKGTIEKSDQVLILAALEKRIRHNLSVSDGIYGRIRHDILATLKLWDGSVEA